jgi:membrane-associated phospholipid phosphatase
MNLRASEDFYLASVSLARAKGESILPEEVDLVLPDHGVALDVSPRETTSSRSKLRVAEKLALLFFTLELAASLHFPLALAGRLRVWGLSLSGAGVLLLLSHQGREQRGGFLATFRDWYPCALIPVAYRASGVFFAPDPLHRLDRLFVRWDNALLQNSWVSIALSHFSPWLGPYLEFSYLLTYPLVPLGLLAVTLARRRSVLAHADPITTPDDPIDRFWTPVLLAVLVCYLLYPLFPLTPPRLLFPSSIGLEPHSALRKLNLWLLHQNGDQASLFPSGHVAAVIATALAVRAQLPRVGWVFLLAAASVTLATVLGRYHYAADAAAGAAVAVAGFVVSKSFFRRKAASGSNMDGADRSS